MTTTADIRAAYWTRRKAQAQALINVLGRGLGDLSEQEWDELFLENSEEVRRAERHLQVLREGDSRADHGSE